MSGRSPSQLDAIQDAPRLFPTAAELGVPPVNPRDADLSRVRVLERDSPEGQEELRRRAERKAQQGVMPDLTTTMRL